MASRRVAWETAFLDALRISGVVQVSCRAAGIHRKTAYHRRKFVPSFREAWDAALDEALDAVELAVMRAGVEGTDMQTARWILSRRRPDVWGDKQDVTLRGADGGAIQVDANVHLPDPETWAEIIRIRTATEGGE